MTVNTEMDNSQRLGQQGRHNRGGTPGLRWQLTGVRRYPRSDPPNLTRFSSMASWRRRELDSVTFRRHRTAVAVGDGEVVQLALGVDAGKLWCSSGEDEGTKGAGGLRRSFRDG
jgi:hypothetical protein